MKRILIILVLLVTLAGCEKLFLGEDQTNDPVNNFELFWHDFDQHYGLFLARGWDWDSIYRVYQPQINAQTTEQELWSLFSNMISYLDDGHTFISNPAQGWFFRSGSEENWIVAKEFSIDLVKNKYLETFQSIPNTGSNDQDVYIYGKVKDRDIGYVYLSGIEADDIDFMDYVLRQIGQYEAIILDLRNNTGGDDLTSEAIAGRFADGEHFIYTVQDRNGPDHTDFTEKTNYYTHIMGNENYIEPLIVLTDRITISAAETLLLYLRSFSQVTQIGDTTAGDFSDKGMRRFLPNGWQYQYSIMMFLLPDGRSLDGIGHVPDVQIRNSAYNIQFDTDLVLEKAVEYLFDEYGIE
jgi:carboxyl-terminal processing protease